MRLFAAVFFLIFSSFCFGDEASQAIYPFADKKSNQEDGLVWNKWDTENFVVLSLDKNQGIELKNLVETVKDSVCENWFLDVPSLPIRCKIMFVPNRELLAKLFNIDAPHMEVRRNADGKVSLCAIWITTEDLDLLPFLVCSLCVADDVCLNKQSHLVQRGISFLSKPLDCTRRDIIEPGQINSKNLLSMTREKWISLTPKEKQVFDAHSAIFCLLLRKEFGGSLFARFAASANQDESSLRLIYGFKDLEQLDSILKRYSENLIKDIDIGIVPDDYLTVGF